MDEPYQTFDVFSPLNYIYSELHRKKIIEIERSMELIQKSKFY